MTKYKAQIEITLRKGILDVQGKAVEHALHSIDYTMLSEIRIGKYVELNVETESPEKAKEFVQKACEKLIANPIIEDFEITITE